MPALLRYSKWRPRPERGMVVGRFYVHGRLRKADIATLEEAEYLPDGSEKPGAAAERRRQRLLMQRWEAKLAALSKATPKPAAGGILFSEAARQFLAHQQQYRRARTVELQGKTVARFQRIVGDLPLAAVGRSTLATFAAGLPGEGLAPVSVNIELRHLRRLLRWSLRSGLVEKLPFVEMVQHTRAQVRPASPDRVWELWHALTAERAALKADSYRARVARCWQRLLFNLMRGMRRGEAAHRLQADYQVDDRADAWIWVRDNEYFAVKQHLQQRYPVDDAWVPWLRKELRETKSWVYWCQLQDVPARPAWKDANAVSKLMRRHWGVTAKSIRKAVASRALAAGADPLAVSALLGHSQLKTTDNHYLDSREPLKRRAAAASPFGAPVEPKPKRKRKQRVVRDS